MRKLAGFALLNTILAILVIIIVFSGGVLLGSKVVRDYKTEVVMRECNVIDDALHQYAISHTSIQDGSVKYDTTNGVQFTPDRIYPESLKDLGVVRDEQAYFAKDIDLTKFDYKVTTDPDTKLHTYTLAVHMPNGFYYTSPLSGK